MLPPPTGSLRWRPPKPPVPWSGVRSATSFASSAFQFPQPANSIYYGGETFSPEDCLYLNIYTGPETTITTTLRPVLVWFQMLLTRTGRVGR
jgi:para-nitrobenzyl esterase